MITHEILEAATDYARQPHTTYPGLRRFIELGLEDAARAAIAKRGNVALDSVPRVSCFGDPEASAAADAIRESIQHVDPLPFFSGVPWRKGMDAYEAHVARVKPKSKGAYV